MKLTKVTNSTKAVEKNPDNVKRGRNARAKGGNYERQVAKLFKEAYNVDLKRTPQSGGFAKNSDKADDYRGDITIVDPNNYLALHVECKNVKTLQLPKWIHQAESDCPEERIPVVIYHQFKTSNNYINLRLEDFLRLVEKDKIIRKRVFKK